MKKNKRTIASHRPYAAIILGFLVIGLVVFLLKNSTEDKQKDSAPPPPPANTQQTSGNAPPSTTPPSTTTTTTTPAKDDEKNLANVSCQEASDDLILFAKELDNQPYVASYTDKEPSQHYLGRTLAKLLDTPPINNQETSDLLTVIKNTSHLFRVLGPKDLSLLKAILEHEHGSLEQRIASLYAWSTRGKECQDNPTLQIQLPLDKTYEYAAFFLNTLGGQSYLARRDPVIRVLIRYYCLLIVHQADRQGINSYHIDLPYHLKAIATEITNSNSLENQALYLATLEKIKNEHRSPLSKGLP